MSLPTRRPVRSLANGPFPRCFERERISIERRFPAKSDLVAVRVRDGTIGSTLPVGNAWCYSRGSQSVHIPHKDDFRIVDVQMINDTRFLVTARFQQSLHGAIGLICGSEELTGRCAALGRLKKNAG
jgi:hypothetical protein